LRLKLCAAGKSYAALLEKEASRHVVRPAAFQWLKEHLVVLRPAAQGGTEPRVSGAARAGRARVRALGSGGGARGGGVRPVPGSLRPRAAAA
jgi:hypothetical protein